MSAELFREQLADRVLDRNPGIDGVELVDVDPVDAQTAEAALEGRDHVIPDDVQSLAVSVLSHRLMPSSETQLARRTTAEVVEKLLVRDVFFVGSER